MQKLDVSASSSYPGARASGDCESYQAWRACQVRNAFSDKSHEEVHAFEPGTPVGQPMGFARGSLQLDPALSAATSNEEGWLLSSPATRQQAVPAAYPAATESEVAWVWPPCLAVDQGLVELAVHIAPRAATALAYQRSLRRPAQAASRTAAHAAAAGSCRASCPQQQGSGLQLQVLHLGQLLYSVPVASKDTILLRFYLPGHMAAQAGPSPNPSYSPASPSSSTAGPEPIPFAGVLTLMLTCQGQVGPAVPILVGHAAAAADFQHLFNRLVDREVLSLPGSAQGSNPTSSRTGQSTGVDVLPSGLQQARGAAPHLEQLLPSAGRDLSPPRSSSSTSGSEGRLSRESSGTMSSRCSCELPPVPPLSAPGRGRRSSLDRCLLMVHDQLHRSSMDGCRVGRGSSKSILGQATNRGAKLGPRDEPLEEAFQLVWTREMLLLSTDLQYLLLCTPDELEIAGTSWDGSVYLRTLAQVLEELQAYDMWSAMAMLLQRCSSNGLDVLDSSLLVSSAQLTPAYLQEVFTGARASSPQQQRPGSFSDRTSSSTQQLEQPAHRGDEPRARRSSCAVVGGLTGSTPTAAPGRRSCGFDRMRIRRGSAPAAVGVQQFLQGAKLCQAGASGAAAGAASAAAASEALALMAAASLQQQGLSLGPIRGRALPLISSPGVGRSAEAHAGPGPAAAASGAAGGSRHSSLDKAAAAMRLSSEAERSDGAGVDASVMVGVSGEGWTGCQGLCGPAAAGKSGRAPWRVRLGPGARSIQALVIDCLMACGWLSPLAVTLVLCYCVCCLPMLLPSLQQMGGAPLAGSSGSAQWCPPLLAPVMISHCLLNEALGRRVRRRRLALLALHRLTAALSVGLACFGAHQLGYQGVRAAVLTLLSGL